ncbi:hypothetical protein LSTR_LSTR000148 [Laodelphax striatellus]|uniref:Uncharacterized protein n=1 Tax=Laodelphax striatellus TaxID=195883 RepID=A0A482X6N2_LAOST|nr:hypothetical protein LSTR_LSTR000148 [Laodelphax striatellus]
MKLYSVLNNAISHLSSVWGQHRFGRVFNKPTTPLIHSKLAGLFLEPKRTVVTDRFHGKRTKSRSNTNSHIGTEFLGKRVYF